jgi:hypothetical protein
MKGIPPYLEDVLVEATEYHEENSVTAVGAAHEIAHQNATIVQMDSGERNALDVLKDIRKIHTLCADEFETYRQGRQTDYTDSILEAVALRSREELIAVHLSDNQKFNNETSAGSREVEYFHDRDVANIVIHVTAKEAVDIDNAIGELVDDIDVDHPRADDLDGFNLLWKGGINGLNDASLMLTSTSDVEFALEALSRYEPREADFTTRLQHAVLDAISAPESHIDPADVGTVDLTKRELAAD